MALARSKSKSVLQGRAIVVASFLSALLAGCAGAQLVSSGHAPVQQPLHLSAHESEHMRAGMRAFLESIEGVTRGIAENKRSAIARSAKRSGWSMMDATATETALKLPPQFVAVSIDTHQKFDDLAASASSGAPKAKLLEDLGHILANCTSCHAMYRLAP
ncbi:MAG: hypothetical protein ACK4TP_07490 [Hyphomicrobium sp.]|jgi:cytochrome c556